MKNISAFLALLTLCIYLAAADPCESVSGFGEALFVPADGLELDDVEFVAELGSTKYYFGKESIKVIDFKPGAALNLGDESTETFLDSVYRSDLIFLGANPEVQIIARKPSVAKFNYYLSNRSVENLDSYKEIVYKNLYDKVDLIFYFDEYDRIKSRFEAGANSDLGNARIRYVGAARPETDGSGKPAIFVAGEKFRTSFSVEYPNKNEIPAKEEIICFAEEDRLLFKCKNELPMRGNIDLLWSTYFGGAGADHAYELQLDRVNNIYLAGTTLSDNFPTTPGAFQSTRRLMDAYIAKFSYQGEMRWCTLYGGSESEYCNSAGIDTQLRVSIAGWTWSDDFPVSGDAFQTEYQGGQTDGFVVRFDENGNRYWGTYFGGPATEHIYDVTPDGSGDPIIAGWTTSHTFPVSDDGLHEDTKNGAESAFVAKLTRDGVFDWGTYLGGDSLDVIEAIDLDLQDDSFVVCGYTKSDNMPKTGATNDPTHNGQIDGFVARYYANGQLNWVSYIGGSGNDYCEDVMFDASKSYLIAGYTDSDDFPTQNAYSSTNAGSYDAFLTKWNRFSNTIFATYIGGSGHDQAFDVAICEGDRPAIGGRTLSEDWPAESPTVQRELTGASDACAAKFYPDGQLEWSTFLGGSGGEWAYGIASDLYGNVFLAGDTDSPDFPIINSPYDDTHNMIIDGFLAKMCASFPEAYVEIEGDTAFCVGGSVKLSGPPGYKKYLWNSGGSAREITVEHGGTYFLTVWDDNNCFAVSDPVTITVYRNPYPVILGKTEICEEDSARLSVHLPFESYLWSTGSTDSVIYARETGAYSVTVIDSNGCEGTASHYLEAMPVPDPHIRGPLTVCANSEDIVYYITGNAKNDYIWDAEGGDWIYGKDSISIIVDWGGAGQGVVYVTEVGSRGCVGYDTIYVDIADELKPEITSDIGAFDMCEGDSLTLDAGEGYAYYRWNDGASTRFKKVKTSGEYSVIVRDASDCEGFDTVTVVTHPNPEPIITGPEFVCEGQNEAVYVTEDVPGYNYEWTVGGGDLISGQGTPSIVIRWPNSGTGTADLKVTVGATDCMGVAPTLEVEIAPKLIPEIIADGPLEFCRGDSVTLRTEKTYDNYLWSTGETTEIVTIKDSGDVWVYVEQDAGCSGYSDTLTVVVHEVPEKPEITVGGDTLFCTRSAAYQWNKDGAEIPGANEYFYFPTETGTYSVRIENEFGCDAESDELYQWRGVAFAEIGVPDTIFVKVGELFDLPASIVRSDNLNRVGAYDYKAYFRFNKSTILPRSDYETITETDSEFDMIVAGTRGDSVGLLTNLEFLAVWGDEECSEIFLDSLVFEEWEVEVDPVYAVMCLTDLCRAGGNRLYLDGESFSLSEVKPNPVSGIARIDFSASEVGFLSLEIRSVSGRKVADLFAEDVEPGEYFVEFDAAKFPSGVYSVILRGPTQIEARRMIIAK